MARKVEKSEDQKTWELLSNFWRGYAYNQHGQSSNGHQNQKRAEYKSYTAELQALAERGLVAYDNETLHWDWTKAGTEWVEEFLAESKQKIEAGEGK